MTATMLIPLVRPALARVIGRMSDAIGRQIPEGLVKRILLHRWLLVAARRDVARLSRCHAAR